MGLKRKQGDNIGDDSQTEGALNSVQSTTCFGINFFCHITFKGCVNTILKNQMTDKAGFIKVF